MQFTLTAKSKTSKRVIKRAVICSLIVLAIGAMVVDALTKQRQVSGDIILEACRKGANGQWEVFDRARGRVSASASVLDVARGKEFKSNLKWEPRSEQGRQISLKQVGEGKATVDAASGEVNVEIPINVSIDGRALSLTAKLTNRTITTPLGTVSGKRLEIRGATLSAGVVGFIEIKEPGVVEALLREPTKQQAGLKDKGLKNNSPTSTKAESVIVVIKAQGSASDQ